MKKLYQISIALAIGFLLSASLASSQDEIKIAATDFTGGVVASILTDSIEAILAQRGTEGKDSNVVFLLSNGGVYFATRPITNSGFHLRLYAEDPDGAKPVILLKQNSAGGWNNMLDLQDDATFMNIHINSMKGVPSGTDYDSNKNGIKKNNSRVVFDGCYLERSKRATVYITGLNTKVYLRNCRIGNMGSVPDVRGFGDVVDCRSLETDTVVVQNCTMYDIGYHILRTHGNHVKYFNFDHNTGVNWYSRVAAPISMGTVGEAFITNNIAQNPDYFGSSDAWNIEYEDTIDQTSFVMLDTSYSLAHSLEGKVTVRNNNFFYDDAILNFYNTRSVVRKPGEIANNIIPILQGDPADAFFEEQVEFTKVPPMLEGLQDLIYPTDDPADAENKPAIFAFDTIIGIQFIDASYPTSSLSYTAADRRFPLGDLNWFPEQKAIWEAGAFPVSVEGVKRNSFKGAFAVYPNPAGTTTTMQYSMSEPGESQIMIYDLNGRLLQSVEKTNLEAGIYKVEISLEGLESGAYLIVHKTGYGVHNATYLIKK